MRRWRLMIGAVLTGASALVGAEFPIRHVVLYKNGVALFERSGQVAQGEQARLEFRTADMNDLLKSLLITDEAGHRITSIRYDSNEPLEQRLKDFPFSLRAGQFTAEFLDGFRGAAIEIKTGTRTLSGSILSGRAIRSTDERREVLKEQITLLLASGEIQTLDLGAVSSFSFPDAHLQSQLKQYLQTVNETRNQDRRSVTVESEGAAARNLRINYVVPAAIWKSSYRLMLDEAKSTLEGWAIVDNTSDEDWNGVQLSVVSGRPVSFISQLDMPRYGHRDVVELPEDKAAGPVVYEGGIAGLPSASAGGTAETVEVQSSAQLVPLSPQADSNGKLQQFARKSGGFVRDGRPVQDSTVQSATGTATGELFEYNFAQPVTIKRSESAMIPFLQDRIAARKLLIFTDTGSEHPVNAAEVSNTTGKTLDGGPLTVFDGGAYAGEALVETVKTGDKRLVGYAVDYGTRITTAFDSGHQSVREVHAADGVLRLRFADRQTRTYTIHNVDAKPKTLLLQQEGVSEYSVLSPKPSERTATAYRFEVALAANQERTFKVEQERVYANTTAVSSATPDYLFSLLSNKQLSDVGKKQLAAVLDAKRRLAKTNDDFQTTQSQIADATNDQTRLRQNIDSLNKVSGQESLVRLYSGQLATSETNLAKLRDTQASLLAQKSALEVEVRNAIDRLDF